MATSRHRLAPVAAAEGESDANVVWLSASEQLAWQALVTIILRLSGPLDAQLRRDSNMTLFEYLVLSSLSMSPQRSLRMSELARLVNASATRLSNVAGRLETGGLLVRSTDTRDARSTVATLTNRGMECVERAAPGHVGAVRRLVIDALTPEQLATLPDISANLLDAIEAEA